MSSKSSKRSTVEVLRIWVEKSKMKAAFSKLTEGQAALVSASITKSLPDDYEMFPTDELKSVLSVMSVEWRDTKIKPKVPIAPAVTA